MFSQRFGAFCAHFLPVIPPLPPTHFGRNGLFLLQGDAVLAEELKSRKLKLQGRAEELSEVPDAYRLSFLRGART